MEQVGTEPGFYEADGALHAHVEQQRSDVVDQLRVATAVEVMWRTPEGENHQWSFYRVEEGECHGDVAAFLGLACCRTVRNLAEALDADVDTALEIVRRSLDAGAGEPE